MNKNYILMITIFILYTIPAMTEAKLPYLDVKHTIEPAEFWTSDSMDNPSPDAGKVTLMLTGSGNPYSIARPMDIIFAIDSSGSMSSNDPDGHRIAAAQEFIDKMNPYKDRVGMVSWNDDVVFDISLTNNFYKVKQVIANVDANGGTSLDNGLDRSIDLLSEQPRTSTKAIIFLSDGDGDYTPSGAIGSQTDRARSEGILIYTIGLGETSGEEHLEDMADTTGGKSFFVSESSLFENLFQDIFKRISNIAARNIEVAYAIPPEVQPFGSIPPISIDSNGNKILKWTIGQLTIGESWDASFYVSSRTPGTFTLGSDSSAVYANYDGKFAEVPITPAIIHVERPYHVGDLIWVDKNGNGIQDPDENGKAGITVSLLDSGKNPMGVTTITDVYGNYHFDNLEAGTYYIKFIVPRGYLLSPQNQGTNTERDSDPGFDGIAGPVTLMDKSDYSIDAGLIPNDSIGDVVWVDKNKNGLQDSGEHGIAGITIALLDYNKDPIGLATATDINGSYHFNNLEPGTYYVKFAVPDGYILSPQEQGDDAKKDSNPLSDGIAGPVILTDRFDYSIDAGLIPSNYIGDLVWVDKNGNGIQDIGEKGKAGATVTLLNSNRTPARLTATTDANGNYRFQNLEPGTYYVKFAAPGGYILSPQKQGTDTERDSDSGPDGITLPIILTNKSNNSIDQGLVPNDCIGDLVWVDKNGNGIQEKNDEGRPGALVDLLDSNRSSAGVTTITDDHGNYHLRNLEPGVYYVKFTAPRGYVLSSQNQTDDKGGDINPSLSTILGPVVLTDACDNRIDISILPLCIKVISIKENSGKDLLNYSVLIKLSRENFPEASNKEGFHVFFCDGNNRPLNHWIEEWNQEERTAKVWVKVPFIPAHNKTEITMQYYNEGPWHNATYKLSQGDGHSLFDFFDDFSASAVDPKNWTTHAEPESYIKENNGTLQIHTDARSRSAVDIFLKDSFGPNTSMRFRANISKGQGHDRKGLGFMNTNVGNDTNSISASVYWRAQDEDLFAHHIYPVSGKVGPDVKIERARSDYEGGFKTWEVKWLNLKIVYALDSQELKNDAQGKSLIRITPRFSLNTTMASSPSDIFIDWVFVRNCVDQEPTVRFSQEVCMN